MGRYCSAQGKPFDPRVKDIPTPKEWKSSYSGSFGLETRNSVEIRTETIVVVVEMRLRFPSPFFYIFFFFLFLLKFACHLHTEFIAPLRHCTLETVGEKK
jgi:hypothetical protein